MSKIINEEFHVGDSFIGLIDGSSLIVKGIGKDPSIFGTESGNTYQKKDIYVCFLNVETGKIEETNLKTAQRLLLRRECF